MGVGQSQSSPNPDPGLDRAQWKRFGNKSDLCILCGARADVTISVNATEFRGEGAGKGGANILSREQATFCNDHALVAFEKALKAIRP